MKYKLLSFTNAESASFLPEALAERCLSKKAFCFAALEDQIAACAVFTQLSGGQMRLDYLYVLEDQRGRGIAKGLLAFAEESIFQGGEKSVVCRLSDDGGDDFFPLSMLLNSADYILSDPVRALYAYPRTLFADSSALLRLDMSAVSALRKGDIRANEWGNFVHAAKEEGFVLAGCEYDPAYSSFIRSKGSLTGCLFGCAENGDIYVKPLCQLTAGDASKYTLLYLLRTLTDDASHLPESTMVHLPAEDDNYEQLYRMLFGKPFKSIRLYDYYKRI